MNIFSVLNNYLSSASEQDIVFETTLSKEDRATIHRTAQRLGLKTRSEGKEPNRFLVVSKKKSNAEIFNALQKGENVCKYQLVSTGDSQNVEMNDTD